jgi:hypothetical protein
VRRIVTLWLLGSFGLPACKDQAPSPAEICDRAWTAHELVIAAGEQQPRCADAGAAMLRVYAEHREAFAAGVALERGAMPSEVRAYIEAHEDRYADLATRMEGLSERCADDPGVQEVFRRMENP